MRNRISRLEERVYRLEKLIEELTRQHPKREILSVKPKKNAENHG